MKGACRSAALVVAVGLAGGCALPQQTDQALRHRQTEAELAAAKASAQGLGVRPGPVAMHDGIWVGGRSLVKPTGDALPASAEGKNAVVLNSMGAALQLKEIAAEITAQTGLPVILDERGDGPPAATGAGGGPAGAGVGRARGGMALAWNGPLSGLLDGVAAYFAQQWEYRGGQVRIFRNEVRTFTLAALPSSSTTRAGVSTTGGSNTGQGASATASSGVVGTVATSTGSMMQDTTNESTIKVWDDIKETIQAMLPAGGKVAMSPATGTVTVIAPPLAMRRIASYIEQQNARITRQVTVSVKILRVDLTDTYDLGLDLGVVFQQMAGKYAIDLAGPEPLKVAAASAPAAYVVKALPSTTSNSSWATSSSATRAAVDALQTMGKVTLLTESSVTTLNGQAAPISVAEQQSYVASTATTLAGVNATSQTQVTPATLVTGFNMQILPRVLDDGEVLLQYGLSLSDLKAMNVFNANGTQVQLPDVNIRSFLQEARLKSGDLLVLAGYQSTTDTLNDTGLPGLGPSLLGGSVQAIRNRSVLVIMMTPQVRSSSGGGAA